MSRRDGLIHGVYQQLGQNKVHQRWIRPYREGKADISVLGLAEEGTITISPQALVPIIIHECLHRHRPTWSERSVDCATTYLVDRMTDDDMRALYDAYSRKVKILKAPVESE